MFVVSLRPSELLARAAEVVRGKTLRNLGWIYVLRAIRLAINLAVIPLLARRLGPSGLGTFVVAQSAWTVLSAFLDVGTNQGGARSVAAALEDRSKLSQTVYDTLAARGAAACLLPLLVFGLWAGVPVLHAAPAVCVVLFVVCLSDVLDLSYLFMGRNDAGTAARVTFFTNLLGLPGLVLFVHGPEDAWIAFACLAVGHVAGRLVVLRLGLRGIPRGVVRFGRGVRLIWERRWLIGQVVIATAQDVGMPLLAACVLLRDEVDTFSGVTRVTGYVLTFAQPVIDVSAPLVAKAHAAGGLAAARRRWAAVSAGVGAICGGTCLGLAAFAPWVLGWMLGEPFVGEASLFRLLLVAAAVQAAGNVLHGVWLIPVGRDGLSTAATVLTAIAKVLACVAIGLFGQSAWAFGGAVLASELFRLTVFATAAATRGELVPRGERAEVAA